MVAGVPGGQDRGGVGSGDDGAGADVEVVWGIVIAILRCARLRESPPGAGSDGDWIIGLLDPYSVHGEI